MRLGRDKTSVLLYQFGEGKDFIKLQKDDEVPISSRFKKNRPEVLRRV